MAPLQEGGPFPCSEQALAVVEPSLQDSHLYGPGAGLGVHGRRWRSAWEAQAKVNGSALVQLKLLPPAVLQVHEGQSEKQRTMIAICLVCVE